MKNYFRIFAYGRNARVLIPLFILFTFLGVVFSAFNLTLIIPFMEILFDKVDMTQELVVPESKYSVDYAIYSFKSYFLNLIKDDGKEAALVFVCLSIATSVLLTNVFRYSAAMVNARFRTDTLRNLRNDLFEKVSGLHIGFFTNERKGDMISRMTNDVLEIQTYIIGSLRTLFKEPLQVIVYFIFLMFISMKLTLFTLLVLPIAGGFVAEIIKRLKKQAKLSQKSLGRIVNIFDEMLGGMRVIKAFNAKSQVNAKMRDETEYYRSIDFSMARKRELASPLSEFLGVGIVIIILYYGSMLILNNESVLTPSEFISYLAIFSQIISPAKAFSTGISNLPKGLASAERIFETIDTEPQIRDRSDAVQLIEFKERIEFRDVSFSYDKELILKNIDIDLPKGKMIALVGASGAGKSTLADLLPRFYDPTQGSILLDGEDIRNYGVESLRKQMGIVTQESILFNDTVFANISFGKPSASREEVEKAARIANAHEFVEKLEEGYDTLIGERGGRLSGGQRQRISIARAVLKDPAILVLDEATSALDSESEKLVQDALSKLMKNRTSVVIAHRLSTIQHADEILVMDAGKIIERGTHEELLTQGGIYKKLSSMQNVFIDAHQ